MDSIKNLWGREPAMILAFIQGVIILIIVAGVNISSELQAAILTVVALGLGLITRTQVSPVGTENG